jgi:hypothetical protein
VPWEADELHIDPFAAIGDRLEKNAVRDAIERLPDAQQREVPRLIYIEFLDSYARGVWSSNPSRVSTEAG